MTKLLLNMTMSIDGYVAGPDQSRDDPLGRGGLPLHESALTTHSFRSAHGLEGGERGLDDAHAAWNENIGATIRGRNMFGPVRGPWPAEPWHGWRGDGPPFHTPVFVLTHYPRKPLELSGGTTFHFVTDGISSALARAREAANGRDVAVGGGAATVRGTCVPGSSTSSSSTWCRCFWLAARGSSRTWQADRPDTSSSRSRARAAPPTSATGAPARRDHGRRQPPQLRSRHGRLSARLPASRR